METERYLLNSCGCSTADVLSGARLYTPPAGCRSAQVSFPNNARPDIPMSQIYLRSPMSRPHISCSCHTGYQVARAGDSKYIFILEREELGFIIFRHNRNDT